MSNYLIKQGKTYSVKVAIPEDVQHLFDGRKALKRTLRTSDATTAIVRSAPVIAEFKDAIAVARGNPAQHLDGYLSYTQVHLREARRNPETERAAIEGMEEEVLDRLLKVYGVQHTEQLPAKAEAQAARAYKVATGQQTPFAVPVEEYLESRKVEPKTAVKDRHAITEFATGNVTVQEVDRKTVREFVARLANEQGLKNKTIKDRLSSLRVYWAWLADHGYAPEEQPNPFADVTLPKENRKAAAVDTRLPFSVDDIRKLHTEIMSGDHDMMKAAFQIALYTGCRIEEIASLETANVTDDTIQIVRAKTASGNRSLPIHDVIKPLVAELKSRGHKYLLPDLTPDKFGGRSSTLGKLFGRIKTRLGYDSRFVFHSIRKTVATQLEQAGVPEGIAADILGHDKQTMSYGVYSGGTSLEQKREAVAELDYGLNTP